MEELINYKKGQSLFEVVIAIAVTGITLVAIIGLVGSTINNSSFSRDRTLAARHTSQAYEWLRLRRDQDWGDFLSWTSPTGKIYCLNNLPDYPTSPSTGACSGTQTIPGTPFYREMILTYDQLTDPNSVDIEISTTWTDSSGLHESRVSTTLTNWRTN